MPRPAVGYIVVALLVTACSAPTTGGASNPPSPTAATAQPATSGLGDVEASPSPSPPPELALGPDVVAEVVTTDLVMRTAPGVFDESMIYPGRLGPGDRLYLVDGPVSADGFDWYLGDPFEVNQDGDAWVSFGWVAVADKTGEDWVIPVEPDCPPVAGIQALNELPMPVRLACFGDRSIELEGDVTCPDLGAPTPAAEPAWMTWKGCNLNPHGAAYDPFDFRTAVGIGIYYPPDAERMSGHLRITGHFDDPRAAECRANIPVPEDDLFTQELAHRAQQLRCRASLVVTEAVPVDEG